MPDFVKGIPNIDYPLPGTANANLENPATNIALNPLLAISSEVMQGVAEAAATTSNINYMAGMNGTVLNRISELKEEALQTGDYEGLWNNIEKELNDYNNEFAKDSYTRKMTVNSLGPSILFQMQNNYRSFVERDVKQNQQLTILQNSETLSRQAYADPASANSSINSLDMLFPDYVSAFGDKLRAFEAMQEHKDQIAYNAIQKTAYSDPQSGRELFNAMQDTVSQSMRLRIDHLLQQTEESYFNSIKKQIESAQKLQRGGDIIRGYDEFGNAVAFSNSKIDQQAIEQIAVTKMAVDSGQMSPEEALYKTGIDFSSTTYADIVAKSGYVPPLITSMLQERLRSADPETAAYAAAEGRNMLQSSAHVSGSMDTALKADVIDLYNKVRALGIEAGHKAYIERKKQIAVQGEEGIRARDSIVSNKLNSAKPEENTSSFVEPVFGQEASMADMLGVVGGVPSDFSADVNTNMRYFFSEKGLPYEQAREATINQLQNTWGIERLYQGASRFSYMPASKYGHPEYLVSATQVAKDAGISPKAIEPYASFYSTDINQRTGLNNFLTAAASSVETDSAFMPAYQADLMPAYQADLMVALAENAEGFDTDMLPYIELKYDGRTIRGNLKYQVILNNIKGQFEDRGVYEPLKTKIKDPGTGEEYLVNYYWEMPNQSDILKNNDTLYKMRGNKAVAVKKYLEQQPELSENIKPRTATVEELNKFAKGENQPDEDLEWIKRASAVDGLEKGE